MEIGEAMRIKGLYPLKEWEVLGSVGNSQETAFLAVGGGAAV